MVLHEILVINSRECRFQYIVADAGYGSEENYQSIIDDYEKVPLIPYGMYHAEQKKKYKNNPQYRANWDYDEIADTYVDPDGVWFSFSHYSTRTDKNGFQRQFKVYKADKEQEDSRLNELARTPKGKLRTTSVNYNWEYFKQQVKENLESETGKRIYAQRKIDVETVFGRMKGHFGMRRVHVRGKQAVHNDIGLMLMAMNLTKLMLELGRWTAQFSHHSTKKETQQILSQKKAGFCCVSFYLELVISQSLFLLGFLGA